MSQLKETVEHCIYVSHEEHLPHEVEEMEDREDTVILHANIGFLNDKLTEELRQRLIFVDASAALKPEEYSASFFLRYLEGQENTFLDNLA